MAKNDKLSTSRPIEDDFDTPDFTFESFEAKDDRKPATRVLHGLGRGVRDTITDTSFIKKMLRTVLPEGYGMAMDFKDDVAKTARQLYNNAAKEIKPSIAEMAKAADKLAPASAPYLKNSINAIDKWADQQKEKSLSSDDKDDLRNAGIGLTLGETFRFQMTANAKAEARKENRERLQEGVELHRHKDVFGLLNNISSSTTRLAQYQDKITINYQRKHLESSLRTQFSIMDLLTETKAQNAFMKSSLSAIQKNTGLPDFVKLTESERLEGLMRSHIADKIMGGDFMKKLSSHLGGLAKEKVDIFKGAVQSGTSILEQTRQAKEAASGIEDKLGEGAATASSVFISEMGAYVAKKKAAFLAKNKNVDLGNEKLKDLILNAGAHAQQAKDSDKFKYGDSPIVKIANAFRELLPNMGADASIKQDSMSDLNAPQIFTKQTNKSINEVIPGYLARIFREIQVFRTGDDKIGLTTYDVTKNKFLDSKTAAKNAINKIIGKGDKDTTKVQLDKMLDLVDPNKELEPEARDALGKKFLSDRLKGKHSGMSAMTDYTKFSFDPITEKHADVLHSHMSNYFGGDGKTSPGMDIDLLKKQNQFTSHHRNLGSNLSTGTDKVQQMLDLGMNEFLQNTGLLSDKGDSVNIEKLLMYAGGLDNIDFNEEKALPSNNRRPSITRNKKRVIDTSREAIEVKPIVEKQSISNNTDLSSLNKTIAENSSKEESIKATSVLEKIEKHIESGNLEQSVYFSNLMVALTKIGRSSVGSEESVDDIKEPSDNKIFSKGNINVWNFVKGVGKLGKWGLNRAKKSTDVIKDVGGSILGTGFTIASKIGSNISGRVLDKLSQVRDLYLPGMKEPVIKVEMLKAGMYIDVSTGKVLQSLKDITGQVKDTAGNVVLEAKDVKDTFTKSIKDSGIVKLGIELAKRVKDTATGIIGLAPALMQTAFTVATKALEMGRDLLDQPLDIHVRGIELPVMTGLIMRNGGYFDFETGKPILRPSQIRGAVKDISGEVVLTVEQIKQGIFDRNGKTIKTPIQKILSFVKNRVMSGVNAVRGAATFAKNIVTGTLKGAGKFLTRGLGGFSGNDVGSEESIDLLSKIYQVLDTRLPMMQKRVAYNDKDGDGQRDGSWRNQKKKTGKHEGLDAKARDATAAVKKSEQGSGLIGSLIEILTGLFSGGGLLGKALGVGRTLLGVGAAALPMLGSAAGLLGSGAVAAGGALGTAASFAGTALVGTLGVLGSVLSSPVVLGALAVGAAAYGGYKLYKYLNRKPSALVSLRMVQYGFTPGDDKNIEKALQLEDLLRKGTGVKGGRAFIDPKGFDEDKALALFNVSKEDEQALNNWTSWFVARFKPVYLTHYTAIAATDNKMQLSNVDDFKPALKIHYLDLAHFPEGPYDIGNNPDNTSDTRLTNGAAVEHAFKLAKEEATKALKSIKDKAKNGIAAEAMTGEKAAAKLNAKQAKADGVNNKADGIGGAAASASEAQNLSVAGNAPVYRKSGMVESLEGARFRTYGLLTMESEKVNALRQLEDIVTDGAKYNANGSATFSNDTDTVIDAIGPVFGVAKNTPAGDAWINWFKKRFLPVYLTYLGLVKQMAGGELKKGRIPSLKASQELTIINQTSAVSGVWVINTSPWDGYVLGADIGILRDIISSVQEKAKNEITAEALRAKTAATTLAKPSNNKPVIPDVPAKVNNPSAYVSPVEPDAEGGSSSAANAGGSPTSQVGTGSLVLAGGSIADGRGATQYLKLQSGVKLDGLNPAFRTNLNGMVEEYGKLTSKFTQINSGYRTIAEQTALHKANPAKAAAPGRSLHEFGLAVDIPSATLDEMDKLGLMRKYGFTRPVGGEPWHMEAAGIQTDIDGFKKDASAATSAITASLGKGGGGLGTVDGAKKYSRDGVLAKQLLNASVSAKDLTPTPPPIPDNSKELASLNKTVKVATSTTMIDIGTKEAKPSFSTIDSVAKTADGEPKTAKLDPSRAPGPSIGTAQGDQSKNMSTITPGTGGKYSLLPEANAAKGWNSQKDVILGASKMAGVDPKLTASVIAIESGFNPNAQASTSTASGLGQFTKATWKETLGKYGSKYGLDENVSPMDPRANALMTAEYIKENSKALAGSKPILTGTDLYMAHFLGPNGAKKMLSADPSMSAAEILPAAAKSNPNIFYSGNTPRTVNDLYSLLDTKVKNKLSEHGVPSDYFPTGGLGLKPGSSISGLETPTSATKDPIVKPLESSRAPGPVMPSSPQNNTVPPAKKNITNVISPMADVTGFSGKQVQQNSNADMNAALGDVGTTLKQSLDVQTQTLTVLKQILQKSGNTVNSAPEKTMVNDMKDSGVQSMPQNRSPNKLVPVPMSRV